MQIKLRIQQQKRKRENTHLYNGFDDGLLFVTKRRLFGVKFTPEKELEVMKDTQGPIKSREKESEGHCPSA